MIFYRNVYQDGSSLYVTAGRLSAQDADESRGGRVPGDYPNLCGSFLRVEMMVDGVAFRPPVKGLTESIPEEPRFAVRTPTGNWWSPIGVDITDREEYAGTWTAAELRDRYGFDTTRDLPRAFGLALVPADAG